MAVFSILGSCAGMMLFETLCWSSRTCRAVKRGVVYLREMRRLFGWLSRARSKDFRELLQRRPHRLAKCRQFDEVEPALATFTLANEGLRITDTPGEFKLGKTSPPAHTTEHCEKCRALLGMNRTSPLRGLPQRTTREAFLE